MQRRNHGDKHVSYHDNLYETTTHDLLVITTHFLGVVVATVETTTVCYSTQRRRVVVLLGAIATVWLVVGGEKVRLRHMLVISGGLCLVGHASPRLPGRQKWLWTWRFFIAMHSAHHGGAKD